MPPAPTFDTQKSNRFQNVLLWNVGESLDIKVTGYRLYSDNGQPGNIELIYDGSENSEIMIFVYSNLITGVQYSYALEVLNFNGPSQLSPWSTRFSCSIP